jgi:hypothetical protein
MPHHGDVAACRIKAQDVIVGAELPTTEHVEHSIEIRTLGVVLGFGQASIVPRVSHREDRDRGCGGVVLVEATQQHHAFVSERNRGGVLERRWKRADTSLVQRGSNRRIQA